MRALAAVALLAHPVWAASPRQSAQQEGWELLARLEATDNDGSLVEICKEGLTNWEGDVCCPSSCDQCGGDGCLKDEDGSSNDCCIDQIHASNEVCSSASDVKCIMPKTCAEDKCLLECPYDAACVAVWRRRGWTERRRAVVQATYDRLRGALSAAGLAPVGFVNFSQPSAWAVHALEEELAQVEELVSASKVGPKVAKWLRLAAVELAAAAGEDFPGAGGSRRRDTRNSTRSNSSGGSDGTPRAAAQVVLQAGQSAGGAAACRVLPVVVHDPAAMTLLQLQLPSVSLGTSPPLTEVAWARRLLAKVLSAQVT